MSFIAQLLDIMGERLDGAWAVRIGLRRAVPASAASRNMIAFHNSPEPARLRVVRAIAELAQAICDRNTIDLEVEALEACALFMFEAEKAAPRALLDAAGRILPMLMQHRRKPVSPMIAATFPMIYRELAKQDDIPILLQFIPFLDWDRCKAARYKLVDAFMSSSWSPADLALTACRCGDVDKILRHAAESSGGEGYIERIARGIDQLPDKCRSAVQKTISSISPAPMSDRRG